jgi:hypothetical protein
MALGKKPVVPAPVV